VVGCGNIHYDDLFRVPLTSLGQDAVALGERVARLVLNLIRKKNSAPPVSDLLLARLVMRGSAGNGVLVGQRKGCCITQASRGGQISIV